MNELYWDPIDPYKTFILNDRWFSSMHCIFIPFSKHHTREGFILILTYD